MQMLVRADVQLSDRAGSGGPQRDRWRGDPVDQHDGATNVPGREIGLAAGPDVDQIGGNPVA